MSIIDEFLAKRGLKYEDLKPVEQETLNSWLEVLNKNELTLDKIREYIGTMRDKVEEELTSFKHNEKEDIFLKARLRNYMLLQALLSTPEKAKKAIERSIMGM